MTTPTSPTKRIGPWLVFMDDDERFSPAGHSTVAAGRRWATEGVPMGVHDNKTIALLFDPDGLPDGVAGAAALEVFDREDVDALICPTFWVEDSEGSKSLSGTADIRAVRASKFPTPPPVGHRGFVIPGDSKVDYCGSAAVLKFPKAAQAVERGDFQVALVLAEPHKDLAFFRRVKLRAQAGQNTVEAVQAFERLYRHMSLNEELWRLGEIFKHLPFDLEEHPRILELHAQYKRQTSHLDDGETKWYAEGSPSESINDWWLSQAPLSTRLGWVGMEAQRLGFKRVVELGSVDGGSIFSLRRFFPGIEWHGVEVNPLAVAHGKMLAAKHGVLDFKLHHVSSFKQFASRVSDAEHARFKGHKTDIHRFDAVMVFEVLEHNSPAEGRRIIEAARDCVRPGGRIFITTPHGNWSLHDEQTQNLELRKDHIYAFTVKRMREFISSFPFAHDIQVARVENEAYYESNSWVFASFEV